MAFSSHIRHSRLTRVLRAQFIPRYHEDAAAFEDPSDTDFVSMRVSICPMYYRFTRFG